MEQLLLIWESLPYLIKGACVTVELTAAFLCLGLIVGIPLAFWQVYGNRRVTALLISPFLLFFRAIPTLVLLFLFYFGSASLGIELSAFTAAVLAIGFRSSAFQSQIFRGAIQSIPENQMMAARSIGMGKLKALRYIILPQALRLSIPPWTNEYAGVLKNSSLAYALGVTELMRQGRYIVARTFGNALLVYLVCAGIYFVLVYTGNRLLGLLEGKFNIPGYESKRRESTELERT